MTAYLLDPAPHDPEEALERVTVRLDACLDEMIRLIGPNAMQARVAGRVLRAQLKFQGQP